MASFKTSAAAAALLSRAAGPFQTPTVLRTQTELLPLFFMAEMVAEARLACITLGVVLDPKLLSLRILHL